MTYGMGVSWDEVECPLQIFLDCNSDGLRPTNGCSC